MKFQNKLIANFIIASGLLISLVALYSAGFGFGLVFDDAWILRDPDFLKKPLSFELKFRGLWEASYQAVSQVAGPDFYWQRLFNVLLHGVNAILLFVLTRLLVGRAEFFGKQHGLPEDHEGPGKAANRIWLAVWVAVFFWAFNPVAVYAVQYLTQRSTLMATGFILVSLLAFLLTLEAKSKLQKSLGAFAVLLAYGMAVLSKEHAAPGIALLLPLYVYWVRPNNRQLWLGGVTLSVIALAAAIVLIGAKGWTLGAATEYRVRPFLAQLEGLRPGASESVYWLSLVNQAWLFFRYGLLWVLPWVGWMSVDIRPPFPLVWYALPQFLGVLAFLAFFGFGVWALLRRQGRLALLGIVVVFPVLLFSTELAYVRLQEPFVLYRSYLWSITLPALVAIILLAVFQRSQWIIGVGVLVVVAWGALSYERIQSFRSDATVWRDALSKIQRDAPSNVLGRWRPPLNLATWDLNEGRFADALVHAKLADDWGAPDGLAKSKMGAALVALRRPAEALPLLLAAQSEGYQGVELWVSIGSSYDQLGRVDQAFDAYDRALSGGLHERYRPATLLAAGHLANRVGQYMRAQEYYSDLLRSQPNLPAAIAGYSIAMFKQGKTQEALTILSDAIARQPSAELFFVRAQLNVGLGNRAQASQDIAQAIARDPRNPMYQSFQRQIRLDQPSQDKQNTP